MSALPQMHALFIVHLNEDSPPATPILFLYHCAFPVIRALKPLGIMLDRASNLVCATFIQS